MSLRNRRLTWILQAHHLGRRGHKKYVFLRVFSGFILVRFFHLIIGLAKSIMLSLIFLMLSLCHHFIGTITDRKACFTILDVLSDAIIPAPN